MSIEFSEEQKEIIYAPLDERTVVASVAASGKTRCVTERLVYILEEGLDPRKVVTVTFTNNAAAEMNSRVPPNLRKEGHPFMGTLHSYANMLLQAHGHDTSHLRNEDEFDELFDMIYENPEVVKELDYLIVDETQDLNQAQWDFIEFLDPKAFLYVGDVRQSIYKFRGAEPRQLLYMMRRSDVVVRSLTQNYRNATEILKYSNSIIRKMKDVDLGEVKPMRPQKGRVATVIFGDIIPLIVRDNENGGKWGDWAILCRTNKSVQSIMGMLEGRNIPCMTFRQAQGSLEDLHKKMASDMVKVLTVHSSKGLEFNKVVVIDQYTRGEEEKRLNYVAVTRARDELYIKKI